jgi:hypothetical protein
VGDSSLFCTTVFVTGIGASQNTFNQFSEELILGAEGLRAKSELLGGGVDMVELKI